MKRLTLLLIILVLGVFTASAQPENPLDLPSSVDQTQFAAIVSIDVQVPLTGDHLGYMYDTESDIHKYWYIQWDKAGVSVDKYIVKMHDTLTGQKHKFALFAAACETNCHLNMTDVGRLETLTDNHVYTMKIVGKNENGDVVASSTKQTIRVEKVYEPVTLYPYAGEQKSAPITFGWVQGFDAVQYKLIIKHKQTGELVFSHLYDSGTICAYSVCEVDIDQWSELHTEFQNGEKYRWFVKAFGPAGDIATSPKTTFWYTVY